MGEIEIITQLGIGGFGMYILWRIVQELQKQTNNHMVHTNDYLIDITKTQHNLCNKTDEQTRILKDILDTLKK